MEKFVISFLACTRTVSCVVFIVKRKKLIKARLYIDGIKSKVITYDKGCRTQI